MNYDVDYFINKFQAIPEKNWTVLTRHENGKRCALGWCYPSPEKAIDSMYLRCTESKQEISLLNLVRLLNPMYGAGGINNGIYKEYQQPTPKQRILAALYDIKKMQQPQYPDIRKQLAEGIEIGDKTDVRGELIGI